MATSPTADAAALKQRALAALERLAPGVRELALRIHANPEIGFQEERASQWVAEALHQQGYEVERGAAGLPTAIRAVSGGRTSGPAVGLIAEYDALPGIGHACGHNLMAAGMVGAAGALAAVLADLPGRVVYYGTPAEEAGSGKIVMLERGAFRELDAALQYHAGDRISYSTGNLATQSVDYAFTGRPAHAASGPWKGINALDAVLLTFNGIGTLRQQMRPDARVHGIITDGGQAVNIIPERAAMSIGVRSPDGPYLRELVGRVDACARAAALATGAELRITPGTLEDCIRFNPTLADVVACNAKTLGFEMAGKRGEASSDIGNLSQAVPTVSYTLPTCPPGVRMHSHEALEAGAAEIGLNGMLDDARVMVMTAIDLLTSPELLTQIRRDFEANAGSSAAQ
jgi:amidohydrolase